MNAKRLLEFFESHAGKNNIALNSERKTVDRIVAKLLVNDDKYGQRFCPCRPPAGDTDKDRLIICPCVYHLDEVRLLGKCLCGLFVEKMD
jgi:ferredoxin-thioredoxin reductase catalytic subunit